ncbi:ribosome-associated translation inhibitor RaiA [Leptospira ellisii]|uniref:Ribosome hibernation promoting factor n=1 Tax=Leptospira ellisii TaxID=2023197 RepID=A0A2N0B317_9LEPT|nr:ribosome-associated translation inhibitor RaiA [Leptospira ellisii]MDV6237483.1 ribosome-associated translation inhibitor RaiA [Leptospira ellisii]PJZ90921.1 ribosomal subunit interface protein [Leptospira ellisii]PKA05669.1 ribosomal subunit interface protein [Leptospira ellisii]
MKINYNWKNVDHSKAAETYADSKLDRVSKYLHTVQSFEISFEMIHGEVSANLNLHGDGNKFNAQNSHKDIYACIDGLEDKIVKQVSKHHDKKATH